MNVGDLIRVKIPSRELDSLDPKLNGSLGIILSSGKRGPLKVWEVFLLDGRTKRLEPSSLEVISETR